MTLMLMMMLFLIFLSNLIMMLNFFLCSLKKFDREKSSSFECGFDPFCSARLPISIQFYMVSIIFLIFDVEIIIFLPMIESNLFSLFENWFYMIFLFILILLIGLFMEWYDGALIWLK
nr:NADH deshydrogenase subunit 3 [Euceros serricornis]